MSAAVFSVITIHGLCAAVSRNLTSSWQRNLDFVRSHLSWIRRWQVCFLSRLYHERTFSRVRIRAAPEQRQSTVCRAIFRAHRTDNAGPAAATAAAAPPPHRQGRKHGQVILDTTSDDVLTQRGLRKCDDMMSEQVSNNQVECVVISARIPTLLPNLARIARNAHASTECVFFCIHWIAVVLDFSDWSRPR